MKHSKKLDFCKIENLTKVFGSRYVLNGINFKIKRGEILGIIGRSGSGKTTLLNILVGFIKPEKGDVTYHDVHLLSDIAGAASFQSVFKHTSGLKKVYGFAAQNPSFHPNLTVKENLFYFGSLYDIPKKPLQSNADGLLNLMGLSQSQHVIARKLSGGMQRRLDIACALIHDPGILFLDEPTGDLDPILSNKIWNILKVINQKGTTVVLSSHQIVELEHLCDRIAILKDGKIAAIGRPSEIKAKNPIKESIFLKSYPGNYEKILANLEKSMAKKIKKYEIKDGSLIINAKESREVIRGILGVVEQLNEEITNLDFIEPTLDQVFIQMGDEDFCKKMKGTTKRKRQRKVKKKEKVNETNEDYNQKDKNEEVEKTAIEEVVREEIEK